MVIRYETGGHELLDQVGPLWQALNAYHKVHSEHFKEVYDHINFENRKKAFVVPNKVLQVTLAWHDDQAIGYCIASVERGLVGEIESIYVDQTYRGQAIGHHMMQLALAWIDHHHVQKTILGVAVGNEKVVGFYRSFGFEPRTTILQRLDDKKDV